MRSASTEHLPTCRGLRYVLGLWPYLFIAVSVAGLTYIALNVVQ